MNVWKVGTRWGNEGQSVFSLFLDYGIIFVGGTDDGKKQGDYDSVEEGDLFLIADGATPVAIGIAKSGFQPFEYSGICVRKKDRERFVYEGTVVCKADIRVLEEPQSWSFDIQKRFCRNFASADAVQEYWRKQLEADSQGKFEIESRTVSLLSDCEEEETIFHPKIRYRIPIYQRPYSWGEREIDRLLQDITKGVKDDEVLFLGTMQLSAPVPLDVSGVVHRYDIIDGQQRISTFLLLICVLQKMEFRLSLPFAADDVLRTLVNKGEAQDDLEEFLSAELARVRQAECSHNPYLKNGCYIYGKLKELFDGRNCAGDIAFEALRIFLFNNIRIVIIETKAGISKTIQIFNVINTTGLDLNGADIFKVRFFEFLTDKQGAQQDIFDDISGLYGIIEERNKLAGSPVTDMIEVLRILQALLIAKYDLPQVLFDYETGRFFEQLFDTLLGINDWFHFDREKIEVISGDVSDDAPLSVSGIQKLIDCRYAYHEQWDSDLSSPLKNVVLTRFLMQSRYGWRYWSAPVVFMYQRGGGVLYEYCNELVKLGLCYSLAKGKTVNSAHSCIRKALKEVFETDDDTPVRTLATERYLLREETEQAIHDNELASSPVWKQIVCRLSEYLEHEEPTDSPAPELLAAIFSRDVDIEHIQAYNDQDYVRREEVWKEWGPILNGIGNLAMLETSINRSIRNRTFEDKKEGYRGSCYKTIQSLQNIARWDIQECNLRRDKETKKLMRWLFRE